MREFISKIGRFCENHVEKIVLVVAGVICVWLFFTRVIFSPNVVSLDDRTFAPGEIDRYIYEQKAQELRAKLAQGGSKNGKTYASRLTGAIDPNDPIIAGVIDRPLPNGFAGLVESPLAFIETVSVPTPSPAAAAKAVAGRRYRLPLIPDVTDVAANHIRAAAYVPLEEVTLQNTYDKVATEPNDIDLVTVEAKFDTAEVYRRFQASFAGVDVLKEEWRDPCLADPIYAAVQLERQQRRADGSWADWQEVPRSRIESNRDLFKVIEQVDELPPGGLEVRLMQFDRQDITMGLLQPESYQIASAEEDWLPPSFHGKYKELQRKVEQEERREQRDQARDSRGDTRQGSTRGGMYGGGMTGGRTRGGMGRTGMTGQDSMYGGGSRGSRGGRSSRGGRYGSQGMAGGDQYGGTGRGRSARRGAAGDGLYGDMGYDMMGAAGDLRRKPSTDEVYFDLSEELIRYDTDLAKRDEPLLFWVFDDTTEPGNTYRYRVRLGLFNPVAGSNQFVERDMDKKDQVILWSRFSEETEPVEIPRRIYLFAKSVQDRTKTATVEVARYALGYWRTENFDVKPGEAIGKEVEPKPDEREKERERARMLAQGGGRISDPRGGLLSPMGGYGGYSGMDPDKANMPEIVDYTTGKVLVDLVQVNDWGDAPNLRPRMYHDMLYTSDGMTIEHMPVSMKNWPADLVRAYSTIQTDTRREPKAFRAFNKGGLRGRGTGGPGMEGYDDMGGYDEMYDMGGGGGLYNY